MTKIKFSGIGVTEMSGKWGTDVVARNTAGFYLRPNTAAVQPDTTYQAAIRTRMTEVSQEWRTLTQTQMDEWEAASASDYWTWAVRIEKRFRPSGQQLFCKVNLNTYLFNFPITVPPSHRMLDAGMYPIIDTFDADATAGILITFLSTTIEANTILQLYLTASLSAGVNRPRPTLFRMIAEIEAANFTGSIDLTTIFGTRLGTIVPAAKIFVKTVLLDILTGRKIEIEKISTIATNL